MDRVKIVDALGLVPEGVFAITDLQMVDWGRDIIFKCDYRTVSMDGVPDDPVEFDLVFRDCREIKYRIYAHISAHEEGHISRFADLAEILIGKGGHRRDANILTNHFSVTLSYGKCIVERGEDIFELT